MTTNNTFWKQQAKMTEYVINKVKADYKIASIKCGPNITTK